MGSVAARDGICAPPREQHPQGCPQLCTKVRQPAAVTRHMVRPDLLLAQQGLPLPKLANRSPHANKRRAMPQDVLGSKDLVGAGVSLGTRIEQCVLGCVVS
ncbi:hypothetical protein GCM10027436_18980 [Actinophytocola sediminis]